MAGAKKSLPRSYQCVAQIEHWCDRCCRHIMPGEMYECRIDAWGKNGKLMFFKVHIFPSCDYPPEFYEEWLRDLKRDSATQQFEWKVAA